MPGLMKKLLFCGAKSFPTELDLPEGLIWVSVGTTEDEQTKFELEANFLNHHLFEDLLRLSVEEFGYSYPGALRIACEIDLFMHVIDLLRSSNPAVHYMELQNLIDGFYAKAGPPRPSGCHHHHYHDHHKRQQCYGWRCRSEIGPL